MQVRETIQLQALGIGYRQKDSSRLVAGALTAAVRQGELTCLLGRNGIGKSTLLRTLSGFQPPLEGAIRLRQHDGWLEMTASTANTHRPTLSRTVSVVLTEKPDVRNMTAEELVELGRSPYTGFWGRLHAADHAVVQQAMQMVGVESLSRRMVHTLSDGERQKVMIAKALAQQTPVIFLDEPTAFLDFPSKVEMMQLLSRLARQQQKTVFLSTHDVELALQLADCIWLMQDDGISIGTPQQLALDGTLSRFLERDGITFDARQLTIRVERNEKWEMGNE